MAGYFNMSDMHESFRRDHEGNTGVLGMVTCRSNHRLPIMLSARQTSSPLGKKFLEE